MASIENLGEEEGLERKIKHVPSLGGFEVRVEPLTGNRLG